MQWKSDDLETAKQIPLAETKKQKQLLKETHTWKQRKCFQTQYAQLLGQKWTLVLKQGSRKLYTCFLPIMICFPSFFPRVLVCDSNKGSSPFVRIFDFIHLFHKLVFTFCLLLCSLVFYFFKTGVFNFFCGRFLCHFFHFTDFQSKPGKKMKQNHKRRQNGDLVSQSRDFTSKRFEPWYF